MGIFSRISDIVNSNLNALCDSAEDPEKMIRLIIQEMEDTLVEVRSASARVIAEQKTASRRRDRIAAEVAGWEDKAKLAVSKGRDDLAKAALQERRAVEETLRIVEDELTFSGEHIGQLNEEIGQLQQKLDDRFVAPRARPVKERQSFEALVNVSAGIEIGRDRSNVAVKAAFGHRTRHRQARLRRAIAAPPGQGRRCQEMSSP